MFSFLGWKVGPWFDPTFNHKNYWNESPGDLKARYDIVSQFIDTLNAMLKGLEQKYSGQAFHVNLTGTLQSISDWANELHPGNNGFRALAAKFDKMLQMNVL